MRNEPRTLQESTNVYQDNNGCVNRANEGPAKDFHKPKHIYTRHHYVLSMVGNEDSTIVPIRSDEMKADYLTKLSGLHDLHQATMTTGVSEEKKAV